MTISGWNEDRLVTTEIAGATIRLTQPQGGRFPARLRGCESKHQVGFWISETDRPHGLFHYGDHGTPAPIERISYVPSGINWYAEIQNSRKLKPALYCDFDDSYFYDLTGGNADSVRRNLQTLPSIANPTLTQILALLLAEIHHPGFSSAVTIDAYCRLILVELGRSFQNCSIAPPAPQKRPLARHQVDHVRDFIYHVENKPVLIHELAISIGMSASHLRRVFRASTGTSLGAYIQQIRLEKAKILLTSGPMPLKKISHILGFSSPAAFSSAFTRSVGLTPNSYRQISSL